MQGDSESRMPNAKGPDLWRLPALELLEVVRVLYLRPRIHTRGGKEYKRTQGIELLVHTAEPIPVRALSPALFVGKEEVSENEAMGPRDYRFFVLDEKRLKDGAPVRLGWVGLPPPKFYRNGGDKDFRYHPPTSSVSELNLGLRRSD